MKWQNLDVFKCEPDSDNWDADKFVNTVIANTETWNIYKGSRRGGNLRYAESLEGFNKWYYGAALTDEQRSKLSAIYNKDLSATNKALVILFTGEHADEGMTDENELVNIAAVSTLCRDYMNKGDGWGLSKFFTGLSGELQRIAKFFIFFQSDAVKEMGIDRDAIISEAFENYHFVKAWLNNGRDCFIELIPSYNLQTYVYECYMNGENGADLEYLLGFLVSTFPKRKLKGLDKMVRGMAKRGIFIGRTNESNDAKAVEVAKSQGWPLPVWATNSILAMV